MTFQIPDNVMEHIEQLAPQLEFTTEELVDLLKSIAGVVLDQDFITQVLNINDTINEMSADNLITH